MSTATAPWDLSDINLISAALGSSGTQLAADVNGSGGVDATDRLLATNAYKAKRLLASGLLLDD